MDAGGKWANRPSASLRSLFFSWRPQTLATVNERIDVLLSLGEKEPDATWRLLVSLLPEMHESISDNVKPHYRDWAAGWTPEVSVRDYRFFISQVFGIALKIVETIPNRWPDFFEQATLVGPDDFKKVLEALNKFASECQDVPLRTALWAKLRENVEKYTRFKSAPWARSPDEVKALAAIRDHLSPSDPITFFAPLFNDDGFLAGDEGESYEHKQERRLAERRVAIRKLWEEGATKRVLELTQVVKQPSTVGWSLGAEVGEKAAPFIVPVLLGTSGNLDSHVAAGFARQQIQANGDAWARAQTVSGWTGDQIAAWGVQMNFMLKAWDWIASKGEDASSAYWKCTNAWGGSGDGPAFAGSCGM